MMTSDKLWVAACLVLGNLAILVATVQPVSSQTVARPERSLEFAPIPSSFVKPGLTGIYTQLRLEEERQSKLSGAVGRKPVRRAPPLRLAKYVAYASPETPPDSSKFNTRQIVVKFVEGSAIRLRDGKLAISKEPQAVDTQSRLARSGLEPKVVTSHLEAFNALVSRHRGRIGRAVPQIEEADLRRLRQRAELNTGAELPDLNLFYFIHLSKVGPEQALLALKELRKSRIVETAYFQPIPFDAADIPPITTIDVTNSQGYFMAAPVGVDVNFARRFAGGRGGAVRIADIEAGWDTEHEDLPQMSFGIGTNWGSEHGTAVLGEIAAEENGFGATGIAPNAMVGWSSITNLDPFNGGTYFYSVAGALLSAGNVLQAGDIALIEQHFPNIFAGPCPNACNCAQFGYVAVETSPFEHAAISMLTGANIVVVEAAGNGQTLVTPASTRDSGAIIVGASDSGGTGTPACFTNFGPRVNVRSWGDSIGSTGFGDDASLRANGNDNRQWYTRTFGGTSGASPIVTGATALIQSTRDAVGLPKLNSVQMRTLLVSTGVPQSTGVAIGPQPDLRAAIATYVPDLAMFVSQSAAPATVTPSSTFGVKATFQNSGGLPWSGDHTMAITPGSGTMVWQSQTFTLGTAASPVMPADQVSETFSITAPATPGTYRLVFAVNNSVSQLLATSPAQSIVVAAANTTFDNASLVLTAPGSALNGQTVQATVVATNTGTTTWTTAYSLFLNRLNRISLPVNFVSVPGNVPPGQSVTLTFSMICNGTGLGGVMVQMNGPAGSFGQSVGQNVVCQ
jgi:serine protease